MAVTYITFEVAGIGSGVVTEAYLILTGADGGASTTPITILPGYRVDEEALTYRVMPTQDLNAAMSLLGVPAVPGTVGRDATVPIDVTRSITADGTYTFVIVGGEADLLSLTSRETGTPPRLSLRVQDVEQGESE